MPVKSWKFEFARSTEADQYREILRRHQDELRRKEDREDRAEDLTDLAFAVMASQSDIDAYLVTTAHYQNATYQAILENQQLLIEAERERQEMLEKAYVLPDGRRVFESEDGVRVFDEHGVELDPAVISADEIEDWRPKLEAWQANGEAITTLTAEQNELHGYQQKLDEAQERLEAGEISQMEFDALRKDLDESMPDRVRELLPDEFKPQPGQQQTAELVIDAAPLSRPGPMPIMEP